MTVIAWDGKTLAADKLGDNGGSRMTATKVHRVRGHLVGIIGRVDCCYHLLDWFDRGAKPEKWPAFQATDDWSSLLVVRPDGVLVRYDRSPTPFPIEDKVYAAGSARDAAKAAMLMGADARRAIEIAIEVDCTVGGGIDTLTLDGLPAAAKPTEASTMDILGHRRLAQVIDGQWSEHPYKAALQLMFDDHNEAVAAYNAFNAYFHTRPEA